MAFLGQEVSEDEARIKAEAAQSTIALRDELWEKNKDMPIKLAVGLIVGGWIVFRFLFKR